MSDTVNVFSSTLSLKVLDQGTGRPFLLLHGGGGPGSMMPLAKKIAAWSRAVVLTLPGFDGTDQPQWIQDIPPLVLTVLAALDQLDLSDVVLIGNSFGGWLTAETAIRSSPRIVAIVLINACGIDMDSTWELEDILALSPPERFAKTFHNPQKMLSQPVTPEAAAVMAANQAALRRYAGRPPFMIDRSLRERLHSIRVPTLVVWGESDKLVDVEYGRLYARSIPNAKFELIKEAGHLPHVEQTEEVIRVINTFLSE